MQARPRRNSASEPIRKLNRARFDAGVGQLSLVEHALCPLDSRTSLRENLVFDTSYYFTDWARHQREARATVFSPLGLSANDEFYLWGLLAITFAQLEPDAELYATPHYVLRHLGVIDKGARRGGRQYDHFRDAIERLSAVSYRNDKFYDPVRAEHRRVSFGFFSYSLPLEAESSRAWRIAWDPIFFEVVEATGGHMQFDLATYRELDPAARRLLLFVSKVFARRETTPRLDVRHLGEHVLGFAPSLATKSMKVKVARTVARLSEVGVLAPCPDLFQKRTKGEYSLTLTRGPYFAGQFVAGRREPESALVDPLLTIGFDRAAVCRLIRQYSPRLVREWADITLAAKERFGPSFFRRSPQAYFVDNVRHAAAGRRMPPDWWHDVRKAEQAAADKPIADWLTKMTVKNSGDQLETDSVKAYVAVRDRLFGELFAGGTPKAEAADKADELARQHVAGQKRQRKGGLQRAGSVLHFRSQ